MLNLLLVDFVNSSRTFDEVLTNNIVNWWTVGESSWSHRQPSTVSHWLGQEGEDESWGLCKSFSWVFDLFCISSSTREVKGVIGDSRDYQLALSRIILGKPRLIPKKLNRSTRHILGCKADSREERHLNEDGKHPTPPNMLDAKILLSCKESSSNFLPELLPLEACLM